MDDILVTAMTENEERTIDEILSHACYANEEPGMRGDILVHEGVKGMHWYERRYQNLDGSLTPLGRIHYGIGKARVRRAEKKAKAAEKAEAKRVKRVEKLARSGDVDKIYKNRELFTREEMTDAIARAEQLNKFKKTGKKAQAAENLKALAEDKKKEQKPQVKPADVKKAKITLDSIANGAKAAVGVYAAYNTLASAVNMSTGEHTLPQLDVESFRAWKMRKGTPLEDPTGKFYTNVSRQDYEKGNANFMRTKLGKGDEKQKVDGGGNQQQNPPKKQQPQTPPTKQQQQSSPQKAQPQAPDVPGNKVVQGGNFGSMGVVYGPGWKTNLTQRDLQGTKVSDFDNHWTGTSSAYDNETIDTITSIVNALSPQNSTTFNPSATQLQKAFETTTMDEVEKLFTVKSYNLRGSNGYRITSNQDNKYRIYHRGT